MSCGFVCYASGRIDPTQFFYNMCLSFAAVPSLAQLKTAVEERVATDNCVPDGSIFRVGDVEILDFRLGMWVVLESRKQMYSGCQLNVIRSLTTASAAGMADRAFKPPQERTMAFAYEAQLLFEALDIDNEGKLRLPGFLRAYRDNVDFAVEVFSVLDTKVEGQIAYRDFLALSKEEALESLFIEMKRRLVTHGAPLVSSDDEEGHITDHFTFGGRKKKKKRNNMTKNKRSCSTSSSGKKGTKVSSSYPKKNKNESSSHQRRRRRRRGKDIDSESFGSSSSPSGDDDLPSSSSSEEVDEEEKGYYSDSSYAAYRKWKRNRKNKRKKEGTSTTTKDNTIIAGQRGGRRVGLFDDFNLEDIAVNKTGEPASLGGIDRYGSLFRGGVTNRDRVSKNVDVDLDVGVNVTRGEAIEKNVESGGTADRSHRENVLSTSKRKSSTATRISADDSGEMTEKISNSNRGGRPRSAVPLFAGGGRQSPSSAAASPSSSGKERRLLSLSSNPPTTPAVVKSHTGRSSKSSTTVAPSVTDVFSRLTSSLATDNAHNNNNHTHQSGGGMLHASASSPQLSRATSGGSGGRRSIGGGTTSPSTAIPIHLHHPIGSSASSSPTGSGGVSHSPLTNGAKAVSSSPPSFSAGVKRAILNAARERRQLQQKESEDLKLRQALVAISGAGGDRVTPSPSSLKSATSKVDDGDSRDLSRSYSPTAAASKDKSGGIPPLTPPVANNGDIYGGGDGASTSKQQQEKALLVIEKLKALAKRRGE